MQSLQSQQPVQMGLSWKVLILTCIMFFWGAGYSYAQTFISGSTGADGAFEPTANITVTLPPNGILHYTTVTIPAGVVVTFQPNAANTPVTMLATGDVTITGRIDVNGTRGVGGSGGGPIFQPGVPGGPGGFASGNGGSRDGSVAAGSGLGPGGGNPSGTSPGQIFGRYSFDQTFISVLPLYGGSGGGGGVGGASRSGASGGGGGGAIVIASSTKIILNGRIRANGGDLSDSTLSTRSGRGSGGTIRLVAPEITGAGALEAMNLGLLNEGKGRIRLEAYVTDLSVTSEPMYSFVPAPGPVTTFSTPALSLPSLIMTSVGGVSVPSQPGGSFSTADVTLPPGTTNPVPVTVTQTDFPPSTAVTVRLTPQFANYTEVGGNFGTNTSTTVNVTIPPGGVSMLQAYSSYSLPQIASLFPLIEGEPVDRILVASTLGQTSKVMLGTSSGKMVPSETVLSPK